MDTPNEYSPEERRLLLRWAHAAIRSGVDEKALDYTAPTPHLEELRGAFTTLHEDGRLRGCIGYVQAIFPLYRTVYETARAAAFHDPRFVPITRNELSHLQIEISVMSPLRPIEPQAVVVGVHGLVVSRGGYCGLLLPQVASEYGWDRERFLAETCRKAGLPSDALARGAKLEAFTAEVFGEEYPGSSLVD